MEPIKRTRKTFRRVVPIAQGNVDDFFLFTGKIFARQRESASAYIICRCNAAYDPENAAELIGKVDEKHALSGQKNVFLSVGRIVENKRIDLVLNALKIVKERGYDFRFLIVGDGSYKEKLESNVRRLDLEDKVIFSGKIMDRALLSGYYLRSDLFMFPSTFDTASLAPIEAAALKLPSLMTRGCSTAEIITENRNGFLADDNVQSWADTICRIVDDKELLAAAKENCYKEVYRTWDDVCEEVYAFYEKAIREKKNAKK